jgi:hypothetical protein
MNISTSIHLRLKHQHEAIKEIIEDKSKERINHHPAPGKWSIYDNITHLAKYQPVFIARINSVLNENAPVFTRYKAEDDPEFEVWRAWSTDKLIERIAIDRERILELIGKLSPEQLKRIGVHKKFSNLTITMWLEFFLLHEAHHMYTIFQLANDVEIKL